MLTPDQLAQAHEAAAGICRTFPDWRAGPVLLLAVQEVERLRLENARLRADLLYSAERIAVQSEMLSRRAEARTT